MFTLDPTLPATEQIVNQAQAAIDSGRLGEGARLPSVRQLAARLEVSVFTVVNAYDRLLARGVIRSRARASRVSRSGPSARRGTGSTCMPNARSCAWIMK